MMCGTGLGNQMKLQIPIWGVFLPTLSSLVVTSFLPEFPSLTAWHNVATLSKSQAGLTSAGQCWPFSWLKKYPASKKRPWHDWCVSRDLICKYTSEFSIWDHWCSEPHHSLAESKKLSEGRDKWDQISDPRTMLLLWMEISPVQLTTDTGVGAGWMRWTENKVKDNSVKPGAEVGEDTETWHTKILTSLATPEVIPDYSLTLL